MVVSLPGRYGVSSCEESRAAGLHDPGSGRGSLSIADPDACRNRSRVARPHARDWANATVSPGGARRIAATPRRQGDRATRGRGRVKAIVRTAAAGRSRLSESDRAGPGRAGSIWTTPPSPKRSRAARRSQDERNGPIAETIHDWSRKAVTRLVALVAPRSANVMRASVRISLVLAARAASVKLTRARRGSGWARRAQRYGIGDRATVASLC